MALLGNQQPNPNIIPDKEKQPGATPTRSQQLGTGFTNIQKVINANQNNRLGSNIGRSISSVGNQAQQRLGQASTQFQQELNPLNQKIDAGQNINKTIQGAQFGDQAQGQQELQGLANDQNAGLVQTFKQGYQGPQGLQNAQGLVGQAQQASQFGRMAGNDTGRQELLRKYAGGNQYSQGQQRLDSMLLGRNLGQVNQARQQVQNLGNQAQQQAAAAENLAQNKSNQFGALNQAIQSGLQSKQEELGKGIDTRFTATNQAMANRADQLRQAVASGQINKNQYDTLMANVFNNQADDRTFDFSPQQLANMIENNQSLTKSNVATQQELASRNALAKLSGIQDANQIYNLTPEEVEQQKADFQVSDATRNIISKRQQEADAAVNNFKQRVGFTEYGVQRGGGNAQGANLSYQDMQELDRRAKMTGVPLEALINDRSQSTGDFFGTAIGQIATDPNVKAYFSPGDSNKFYSGYVGDYMRGQDVNLQNAINQYEHTKQSYGIGKRLSDLLQNPQASGNNDVSKL